MAAHSPDTFRRTTPTALSGPGTLRSAHLFGLALTVALLSAGCSDTALDANKDQEEGPGATIVGRVEAEAPAEPAAGPGAAQRIEVAHIGADGSLSLLAEDSLGADRSFRVGEVPAGRESLVVVARDVSGQSVGGVLVPGRTSVSAIVEVAPIDVSSALEARVFAQVRALGQTMSYAEATLLVHAPPGTPAAIAAADQVDAIAAGIAVAVRALTEVFAAVGEPLDEDARAGRLGEAAAAFARSRYAGTDPAAAEDVLLSAAVDALAGDAPLEAIVQATAGAATVLDGALVGVSSYRGPAETEPVRLNLRARARLAAAFQTSTEGPVARDVMDILASVEESVVAAGSAVALRSALDAGVTAALGSTISAVVDLLVPNGRGQLPIRVRRAADDAATAARLSIRLNNATTSQGAAAAVAAYRSDVRAAVQSMVATSGNDTVDVDTLTSLFIAAFGGMAIR